VSRTVSTIAISSVLIVLLFILSITNGFLPAMKSQPVQIITVQEAVTLTDKQKINLFISELLDKKSGQCLKNILQAESHFNPKAKNPTSTAKGVGQLLEQTYKNLGLKHSADPLAQVVAAIAYGSRHYNGNFCKAWKIHQAKGTW
jgi:hypothetical protein